MIDKKKQTLKFVITSKVIYLTLGIVLLTMIVNNMGVRFFYHNYLNEKIEEENAQIVSLFNEILTNDDSVENTTIEPKFLKGLDAFNRPIVILDQSKKVLFSYKDFGHKQGADVGFEKHLEFNEAKEYRLDNGFYLHIGNIRNLADLEINQNFLEQMNWLFLFLFLGVTLISVIISKHLANGLSEPIVQLKNGTESIKQGTYGKDIPITTTIQELQQLGQAINALSKHLYDEEVFTKQLTADIGHELKTPLAIVSSQLEAIQDGLFQPTEERITFIVEEVQRLNHLVEDLNMLSTTENPHYQVEKQWIGCMPFLEQLQLRFEEILVSRQILLKISCDSEIKIHVDPDKMMQVLSNILSNSIKYSNEKSVIEMEVRQNNHTQIVIKDNGIGISDEDKIHLFKRFYRGEKSRNREYGGAGIGLSIVKNIMDAHQGQIEILSQKEIGTTVILTLC